MKRYLSRWTQRTYRRAAPITPEMLLALAILTQMRLRLDLFMPRDVTRWN